MVLVWMCRAPLVSWVGMPSSLPHYGGSYYILEVAYSHLVLHT
jgi:hypothetical protein